MRIRRQIDISVALDSSVSCEVIDEVVRVSNQSIGSGPLLNDSTIAHFVLGLYSGKLSPLRASAAFFVGV